MTPARVVTSGPDFSTIPDVNLNEGILSGKVLSTGIVLFDEDEKIWIYEPLNHFGGYKNTFPKGRVEKELTYQQNAHREVHEETGLLGTITGLIGDFAGDVTMTRYYAGVRTGGEPTCGPETQSVKLVFPLGCRAPLEQT